MMGWDDEDDAACRDARDNGSKSSDLRAWLWFSIPAGAGALFMIARHVFDF